MALGDNRIQSKALSAYDTLSAGGILLFVIGLAVLGSGFRAARPNIFGLLLQPYLMPVLLATPLVLVTRMNRLPMKVAVGFFFFTLFFVLTSLDPASFSNTVKLFLSVLTVITVALTVRSRADFVAGVAGLTIAIGLLALHGLEDAGESLGVRAIEVANKNSYSLYALPALLMSGFVILRIKSASKLARVMLALFSLAAILAIFMSGNRSGYLGAVIVGLLLIRERKFIGILLVGLVIVGASYYLRNYGSTEILERRLNQTVEGTSSDTLRLDLFRACVQIGLENPIAGVSPGGLGNEIGRHLGAPNGPHNVFGFVIGSNGLVCFAALLMLGWALWTWRYAQRVPSGKPADEFLEVRKLLRYMVILWVIRGCFNDEILYNPGFCIGIGLAMGLCIVASKLPNFENRATAYSPTPGIR